MSHTVLLRFIQGCFQPSVGGDALLLKAVLGQMGQTGQSSDMLTEGTKRFWKFIYHLPKTHIQADI